MNKDLTTSEVEMILAAVMTHSAFEPSRKVVGLFVCDDGRIRVGTEPADFTAPAAWKREFVV